MKVILISGKAQHGKDTVAGFLEEELTRRHQTVLIAHYGDLLKYICRTFFDWNGEKDEDGRSLLQHVGTDVIRKQDSNFWARFVCQMLKFFPDAWDYVVIPDCRFKNEISQPAEYGLKPYHIRVVRPDFDNGLTPKQQAHPSETALDGVKPDYTLINNGSLSDLRRLVRDWAKFRLFDKAEALS